MELPQPPQDEDLRNIIEKLAVFVARNGQEFESMTKQKQRANPRFAFLFGGEFYNYYMYRVTTEQAVLKHKQTRQQQLQQLTGNGGQNFSPNQNFGMHGMPQRFPPPLQQQSQMFEQNIRSGGNFEMGFEQQQRPPGPSMQNFERGQIPNFERSPMQNFQNRPQGNFSDAGGPHGHFDQRQGLPGNSNFDQRPGQGNFEQRNFGGNFDRPGFDQRPQEFERGPGGPPPGNFDNRSGSSFNRQGSNFDRPNMDLPPGSASGFDRAPNFDRGPPGNGPNFDRGLSGNVPNFERGSANINFEMGPQGNGSNFERPNTVAGSFEFDRTPSGMSLDQRLNLGTNFERPVTQPVTSQPVLQNSSATTPTPVVTVNVEALKAQKQSLEDQILQSEKNLAGQQQVLMAQQQQQIEESIRIVQDAEIKQLSAELNINMDEFDTVLGPIIESCTKDAISNGKAWIFTHTSTPRHYNLITTYLLRKTTDPESSFSKRLHIIYLVNDVLHHCMRKGAEDLQQVLEAMVIPMFCYSKVAEATNEDNVCKLDKLFSLWESKSNYVSPSAVEKLRNYSQTWLEYQADVMKRHAVVVAQIASNMQQTYENYQNQHQMFCQHVVTSIKALEQQIQQAVLQQQLQLQQQQIALARSQISMIGGSPEQQNYQPNIPVTVPGLNVNTPPNQIVPGPGNSLASQLMTGYPGQAQGHQYNINQMPGPSQSPQVAEAEKPGVHILDISRPPPGFPTPPPEKELIPSLPYYELPAGLMVPLVKHEDDNYKPIDPKAIRLPPPCPPSERLIQAVEAFYAPASHERPRDSEGWERLGLYEYYKTTNIARKKKEDDIREGRRVKSRSPTPIRRESSPGAGRSPPRRRYQSKSPTPPKRRRSRSRSPSRRRKGGRRSRSRSRSPGRRSPTPPSFGVVGLGIDRKIDENNKGHQLLKKMGWGGTGLGKNEEGIEAPISGGELREKKDQYKGVGISMNDPFESYRKSKGMAFVERMRQRAEERL